MQSHGSKGTDGTESEEERRVKSEVTKRSKLCIQVTPRSLAADIPLCAKSNTSEGVESYVCDARRTV